MMNNKNRCRKSTGPTLRGTWLLLMLWLSVPLGAWADREVKQLQFGKQVIEVASDEVITFYDPWGTENIVDNNTYNAQSLTVFKPVEAGKSVQVTFETLDLNQYSASYYLYLNIYDGVADADDTFQWATSTSDITASSSLAGLAGTLVAEKVNNDNKPALPASYISSTADGALSVGFMHRNSNKCQGWVAKVKVVTLENMTVTGAASNYESVVASPSSKQNVTLAGAFVTTEGVMNPDKVTGIHFALTQNEGVVDPTALRLYKGDTQVSATVETDGTGYKFVLSEALARGKTAFSVKGDILSTAEVGAKVQLDITKITTTGQPNGILPFTTATSVVVENPALVLMSATPQTVTVGETSLQFYDEGGKDGGIVAKTNGQVTFLSGVEGQKVAVDLTVNKIWHGSYYNQELRFYNGSEVKPANLIKTLQQGETCLVRSTADDGSLTVVLFSDASTTAAADGFEATVSLFTPQPMDFDGISVTQVTDGTVCAGDINQPILDICVETENTEPAMLVTKMAFTANGTSSVVAKASLFFGSQKVGETSVTADAFEIELTEPQALVEGENAFRLTYDISDEAVNGETIDATLVSVTALVNGKSKTETLTGGGGNPDGSRVVENIVLSSANQGTVVKTVNGSIDFNTKTASSYSSYCEAGTDDRINIFIPKHEGHVAQIDFTEFNVQYASTSYGNKSKFRIYAGQGTDGELLWELNDNNQESAGPGQTIRSTAADGALTIVFNPNSSYSYYYKGFKATVKEYQSKPMQVTAVEATQTTVADASIGASDQELLTVNVVTDGNLSPLPLQGLKLNLKATEANISKVSVWQSENLLGEAAAAADITVTFAEVVTLKEGDNIFAVKADVKADAEENQTIDAKVVAAVVGGQYVTATEGDPEGVRTLKNQLLMTEGNHGTLSLGLGKTVAIYDDGGAEADGADGVNATVTLAPTGDADCIKLYDKGIKFGYTAHLYIYAGGEVNEDNLITDLSGSSAKFNPIASDAAIDGGKLTIRYVGAGSNPRPNFAIEAEGYKKTALAVNSITTEDISVSEVLKGQTDVKMLKVAVEVKGDLESVNIAGFNITGADGDAIEAQHIYQTGKFATFSANEAFSGSYSVTAEGTYYFWICNDIKTTATVGQTAEATLTGIVANGETIAVSAPVTATVTIATGKSGDYTVGEGGTYATIQQAVDDLGTLGMEGPVTLKIKAGEYNEKVRIPYIKGMGAQNTLTLESESSERDVKIFHNQYTTAGYSDDQHKKDYGVVTIYEASYVTLRNLEISTTDVSYKAVVMVKDGSRHNTVDNCYLHAPITTSGDVALVNHTIIDEENKNNDYLTVKNSILEGGKYGVYMGGTSYTALPKEVGGVVEGNTFRNNGRFMMYAYDELGAKIRNNTFIIDDSSVQMSNGVIDINVRDEYDVATEITGNVFNLSSANTLAAIYVRQMEATAEAPMLIANNVVNIASANASTSAVKFSSNKARNVNVAHNTVRMTGANGGAAFWVTSALAEGYGAINVVNNIIQNETSGYAVNLYNDGNLNSEKIQYQNNVFYTAGSTFFRAASSTSGNLDLFVEKTGATGSVAGPVSFVSDDILMPAGTLEGSLLTATPLSYVTTDITGRERPAENITIGAYEFAEDEMPVMAEDYPKATSVTHESAIVIVKADNMGTARVLLRKSADGAPTVADVAESELTQTLTADTEAQFTLTELEEHTAYTAYVLLQSAAGRNADELLTAEFTTEQKPVVYPDPLVMIVDEEWSPYDDDIVLEEGSSATFYGLIGNGTAPFTASWLNAKREVLASQTFDSFDDAASTLVALTADATGDYYFEVTDANERLAADTVRVIVRGELQMATFEDLYTDPEDGFWMGNFDKGMDGSTFLSGSFRFSNYACDTYLGKPTTPYWGNFAYSQSTSTAYTGNYVIEQFNNAVGGGVDGSETFLVGYPQGGTIDVLNDEDGDVIPGFYLTNNAWVVDAILNGDGQTNTTPTGPFVKGDYVTLTVKADNGNEKVVYLADYRADNADDRYYLDTWQWIDLSDLGTVKSLSFTVGSSRRNQWGLTTPTYFCMDNLGATRPETSVERTLTASATTLSIADVFDVTDTKGTLTYALLSDDQAEKVSLTGDVLSVSPDVADAEVVVSATRRGKTQYVRLHLVRMGVSTAIETPAETIPSEALYGIDGKTLTNGSRQKGVQLVRHKDGSIRKVARR